MNQAYNGIPAGLLPTEKWRKSGRSNPSGNCVEMARLHGGDIADEIAAFLLGAKDGEFDDLIG
jgi:Domain of unknown function (DUF397)